MDEVHGAAARGDTIYTSDVDDLERVRAGGGFDVKILGSERSDVPGQLRRAAASPTDCVLASGMGEWLDPETYTITSEARGLALQNDAAVFWECLFARLLSETSPFDRVVLETEWDGPRVIAYAVPRGQRAGFDTGWRLQCNVPAAVPKRDRWFLVLAGAGRAAAATRYRELKKARRDLTFWRSDYGETFGERLPL